MALTESTGTPLPADDSGALRPDPTLRVVESVQTVLTALILAFIFRAYLIEAFVIPTGSMAESLLGRHATLACPNCGWRFSYGPAVPTEDAGPFHTPAEVECPLCLDRTPIAAERVAPSSGERILVHKWPFVLGGVFGPRRWDVIVFRDPRNPEDNFIKRLVGLPGERIQIIDGDVFIAGPGEDEFHVARKPRYAQEQLWFPVYRQDYPPRRRAGSTATAAWAPLPPHEAAVGWSGLDARAMRFAGDTDDPETIIFNPLGGAGVLRDVYGYNHQRAHAWVGDVRMYGELRWQGPRGELTWTIARDTDRFRLTLQRDGIARVSINQNYGVGAFEQIGTVSAAALAADRPVAIEFGHVDYRVYVRIDGREVLATTPAQYAPDVEHVLGSGRVRPIELRMSAAGGPLELRRMSIDRDVYYTRSPQTIRAADGDPFELHAGEYFVLGDNSPSSHDGREWTVAGPNLSDSGRNPPYRLGTVPADQIVGRAFFVYLPSMAPLDERGRWRVPDVGRMRFIR